MRFINGNNLVIKLIIFCLLITLSACSSEIEKVVEADKSASAPDPDKLKLLQANIEDTHQKYIEYSKLQQKLKDDITTQLNSISCSSIRLYAIKFNKLPQNNSTLKKLLGTVELLEIVDEKEAKFFKVFTSRKYNYKRTLSGLSSLIECPEYYRRTLPSFQTSKDLEIKVFEEEIASAIKRLNSFPKRFEILERLASNATSCQSFLQKRMNEYLVDKNPSIAAAGIEKYKEFIAETDKNIKELSDISESLQTPTDVSFVGAIFNETAIK